MSSLCLLSRNLSAPLLILVFGSPVMGSHSVEIDKPSADPMPLVGDYFIVEGRVIKGPFNFHPDAVQILLTHDATGSNETQIANTLTGQVDGNTSFYSSNLVKSSKTGTHTLKVRAYVDGMLKAEATMTITVVEGSGSG